MKRIEYLSKYLALAVMIKSFIFSCHFSFKVDVSPADLQHASYCIKVNCHNKNCKGVSCGYQLQLLTFAIRTLMYNWYNSDPQVGATGISVMTFVCQILAGRLFSIIQSPNHFFKTPTLLVASEQMFALFYVQIYIL